MSKSRRSMKKRYVAKVGEITDEPKVKHYEGLPPDLTGGIDTRKLLSKPFAVLLEETTEGIFLHRIDSSGNFITDTWHQSFEQAKEQAKFEYENALGNWFEVPVGENDIVGLLKKNRDSQADK